MRLHLTHGGAGLGARVRYFGDAPDPAFAASPELAGTCVYPPRVSGDAVTLGALRPYPARTLPVVRVLAGHRPVALPMASVLRAAPEEDTPGAGAAVSLAACLGEEPRPAAQGRAAILELRTRGQPVSLRVELLVGHASERLLPPGPLLQRLRWLLGVIERGDEEPLLVIDPLTLLHDSRATRDAAS